MRVCLCRGVSDREVREALACGASTVREVGRACGAGLDCGSCHELLRSLLRAHAREKAAMEPAPTLNGT